MSPSASRIDICVCTYRRPELLDLLTSLAGLQSIDFTRIRVIVADNDVVPSGEERVGALAPSLPFPVEYVHAPAHNISIARNATLDAATAEWVAFLDDDETVPAEWLSALARCVETTGADAAFGHSHAIYPGGAPDWITARDYHSQIRVARRGRVETGHTCNALLRWRNAPWRLERFDPGLGQSGGEDTEFFFRLHRLGARFVICDDAPTYECVPPARLTFAWLRQRKYRIGQSLACSATSRAGRAGLFVRAAAKAAYCAGAAALNATDVTARRFWMLRGIMHAGVCAGCLDLSPPRLYGTDTSTSP
jgi:succinoglycan biosynthesis protein ExoM